MSEGNVKSATYRHPLFLIALTAVILSSYATYQMGRLHNQVLRLSDASSFSESFSANSEMINEHIDQRIDAYIDRKRREKIAKKFEAFANARDTMNSDSHVYGNDSARFTLLEFSDLECPFCKKYHSAPKAVVDASMGLVNWKWKHLPLPFHNPVSAIESHAAECVNSLSGNRAFWVFINEAFAETKGNGQGAGDLVTLAQNMGVDETKFSDCLTSGRFRDKISADIAEANGMGVSTTPTTVVIDNKTGMQIVVRGLQSSDSLVSTIQSLKNHESPAQ